MKTLAFLLALCAACHAKVGERYDDFLKRTGFPSKLAQTALPGLQLAQHLKGEILLSAYVIDGAICREEYCIVTVAQAGELMRIQTAAPWKYEGGKDGIKTWTSKDGLKAVFFEGNFRMMTARGEKAVADLRATEKAEKQKREREKVRGF